MSASPKVEFPPLLGLGFETVTLDQLIQLCVTAFPRSATRQPIMNGLRLVIHRLIAARLSGAELWVDGSFLTEKTDPVDSDVVLAVNHVLYDNGSLLQQKTIDWVESNLKGKHLCDSYVFYEYPAGHAYHDVGVWMRAYWIRQFGFTRKDDPKGIAVFRC